MNQINHNVFIVQYLAEKSLYIIVADKSITKVNILFIMLPLCFQVVNFLFLFIVVGFIAVQWSTIPFLPCTVMLQRSTRSDCAEIRIRFWKPLGMSTEVCQMINHVVALIPPQNMTLPFTLRSDG